MRADFYGAMPGDLELEALELRDAALRFAPRSDPPTGPTLTERTDVVVASKRKVAIAVAAAAALIAAIAGGVLALTTKPSEQTAAAPRFIVVERNEATPEAQGTLLQAPNQAEPLAPTSPDVAPIPAASPPTASPEETPTRPATREEALTRAFASHRAGVRVCFERHTLELSGSPRIEIDFRIGRSGRVESATLEPATLMGTALGNCVLGVARRVTFGPQPGPVRFSIPLTASREAR